jgi:D-3-phosphoglycerate dehydrogenase
LRELDQVILTPHIGASTQEAQQNVAVQVCEQFVDFFKNRLIRNAVNAPSIEPEILENMRPYLQLAECLGKFQSQLAVRRAVRLTAKYSGAVLDYPVSHLTTAVVKAFIDPKTDEAVNYVNALTIAKDMGKKIEETKIQELFQYSNLITVEVEQEDGTVNSVSGTLFTPNAPRIVIVNDKHFDAYPYGNMIVIENLDVPGIIGSVGTLLGKHKINIAQLTWGRRERDQEAMTIINVDQEVSPEALEELRQLPNILSVRLIKI